PVMRSRPSVAVMWSPAVRARPRRIRRGVSVMRTTPPTHRGALPFRHCRMSRADPCCPTCPPYRGGDRRTGQQRGNCPGCPGPVRDRFDQGFCLSRGQAQDRCFGLYRGLYLSGTGQSCFGCPNCPPVLVPFGTGLRPPDHCSTLGTPPQPTPSAPVPVPHPVATPDCPGSPPVRQPV